MPQRQEKSEELYNGIVVLLKACSKVSRFPSDWGCFPTSFSEVTNATPSLETHSRARESQAEPSHTKCQAIFRISVGLFPFISWLLSCPALCLLFFIKAPKCSSKFFFWDKKTQCKSLYLIIQISPSYLNSEELNLRGSSFSWATKFFFILL